MSGRVRQTGGLIHIVLPQRPEKKGKRISPPNMPQAASPSCTSASTRSMSRSRGSPHPPPAPISMRSTTGTCMVRAPLHESLHPPHFKGGDHTGDPSLNEAGFGGGAADIAAQSVNFIRHAGFLQRATTGGLLFIQCGQYFLRCNGQVMNAAHTDGRGRGNQTGLTPLQSWTALI